MARNLDIEILRLRRNKHAALAMALCSLALMLFFSALPGTQATYGGSKNGSHIFVLSQDQNVGVTLTEDAWQIDDGINLLPGQTRDKNPIVQNDASDCYMRINMRITDKEIGNASGGGKSETLDPTSSAEVKERVAKILQMIWYDVDDGYILEGNGYSTTDLKNMEKLKAALPIFNTDCFEPQPEFANADDVTLNGWNDEMKAWSFVYKTSDKDDTSNIFRKGASARFFNKIVYPTDYGNEDVKIVGDFYINVWVQAIQTEGFDSREAAMAELSNNNVENDLSHIDGKGLFN